MAPTGMRAAELPVRAFAERIATAVRDNPFTIIIGETGSGKTTQISQVICLCLRVAVFDTSHAAPCSLTCSQASACSAFLVQILDEAGFTKNGQICVTQPRRVVR